MDIKTTTEGCHTVTITMFAAVLVTVAIHINSLHAETVDEFRGDRHIIIQNGDKCAVPANFRKAFDDFHNELRQNVAGGIPVNYQYFQKRLMYGLIYDCELEMKARIEALKPGSAAGYGIITFSKEYEKGVLEAVKKGLKELLQNRRALVQLIYPKSTRFGCSGSLKRENGKKLVVVTCVYDKKSQLSSFVTKGACTKNEDCTYYAGSECKWHLCYAMEEH